MHNLIKYYFPFSNKYWLSFTQKLENITLGECFIFFPQDIIFGLFYNLIETVLT